LARSGIDCLDLFLRLTPHRKTLARDYVGWAGRIRTFECQVQSLVPYQLGDRPTRPWLLRRLRTQQHIKKAPNLIVSRLLIATAPPSDRSSAIRAEIQQLPNQL
jgi:hypothetical protein